MSQIILAFDNEDEDLGSFFTNCNSDLDEFFIKNNIQSTLFKTRNISDASIQIVTTANSNFIFCAYSHGSEDSLIVRGRPYISSLVNVAAFRDSFFYACACLTGRTLGHDLIANGCKGYIGYVEKFNVWIYNLEPFVECANHGIKELFQGKSISDTLVSMKEKYTEHIDNYNNDIFGAALLVDNRECLVWRGHDPNYIVFSNKA